MGLESRAKLLEHLGSIELFSDLDHFALARLADNACFVEFDRGELVLREGDRSDHILILVQGRLEVFREHADGTVRTIDILRAGALLGEMAVLLDEPRSVSVRALRNARLIRISGSCVAELFREQAALTMRCARGLADRLKRRTNSARCDIPIRTIALIPLCPDSPFQQFCVDLELAFESTGEPFVFLNSRSMAGGNGPVADGIANAGAVSEWFAAHEAAHGYVVCVCDRDGSNWNRHSLEQADLVLCVASADAHDSPRPLPTGLSHALPGGPRCELVLLRSSPQPARGTSAWLDAGRYASHHHVVLGRHEDSHRLVRRLRGQAWGLVLSGGGARGLAHIGVIRAIQESGLPIDMIGGTSMGAIVAAQYAAGHDVERVLAQTRHAFVTGKRPFDLTLPFVSLYTGRSTNQMLQEMFGDLQIEDLPIGYFCVSCNLTRAAVEVHRRGPVWMWARASCAIPGLVPPVSYRGDLLVDGGFLDNLPVDEMRARLSGWVMASDVSLAIDLAGNEGHEAALSWSGARQLMRKLLGKPRLPSIIKVLMRTAEIGSVRDSRLSGSPADLYVHVPLEGISMTDFTKADQIITAGYEHTARQLTTWKNAVETKRLDRVESCPR